MQFLEGMGWWMVIGGILMLVLWGGLIALVVWGIMALVRRGGSGGNAAERRSALDIAKERYARGEITREQYQQMREDLMRRGGGAPSGA